MTKRTIDLDALATELRAAGCETKRWDDDEYPSYLAVNLPVSDNPRRSIEWDVMDDGDVILYDDIQFGDKAFQSVDIIRRAVSPSAPEGLRERIAKAAFDAHSKSIDVSVHQAKWPPHRDWVVRYETEADYILDVIALAGLNVADAVLAVLPPAPRVDVDMVMDLVDLFGHARANAATASTPESKVRLYDRATERFDAIRAMLEPHDAARLDVVTIPRELAERALEAFESISEISAVSSRHKYQCAADANSMKGFLR